MKKTFDQKELQEQLVEIHGTFDKINTLANAMLSETFDQEERLDEKDYTLESINHQKNFALMILYLVKNGLTKSKYMMEKSEGEEK